MLTPLVTATAPLSHEVLTNITITVPVGSRYIADDHLLCTPSTWRTIIPFFLVNYLAHAATVKSIPGESMMSTVFALVLALAFPASGLGRELDAITRCAIRGKTPLEIVCRAQALAVVIRDPRTLPGDELFADDQHTHADEAKPTITVNDWTQSPAGVSGNSSYTSNHATQPNGAMIDANQPSEQMNVFGGSSLLPVAASSTQNKEKIKEIAPCQTEVREESSAKKTDRTDRGALLEPPARTTAMTSGDLKQSTGTIPQDLEGPEIHGLTVTPYLVMSLMNLVSNLLTPDFPLIYLVRDHIMEEAEAKSGQLFERVVAQFRKRITHNHDRKAAVLDNSVFNVPEEVSDMFEKREVMNVTKFIQNTNTRRRKYEMWMLCPMVVFSAVPLIVMGLLTRFEIGHSTHAQRCWFMLWLVFGIYMGLYFKSAEAVTGHSFSYREGKIRGVVGIINMVWAVPAVGGFVVVGQMLSSYGSCQSV